MPSARFGGKGKAEGGAFAFDAFHPDDAVLKLDDLLEMLRPRPVLFRRLSGLVALVEALEDLLLLVVRDADAGVLHANHKPFVMGFGGGGGHQTGRAGRAQ